MQKKTDRAPANKLAYRIDEAGEVSGLGRSSIYELIGDGRLSSVKVGGRRLILHEDLEALLKSSKMTPVARPTPHASPTARATNGQESRELTSSGGELCAQKRPPGRDAAADTRPK